MSDPNQHEHKQVHIIEHFSHKPVSEQEFVGQFADDVDSGLKSCPKKIPSRYFYDETGSGLFKQITALPEYYLTNCENEILRTQAAAIIQTVAAGLPGKIKVIEFGAGDSEKPFELFRQLRKQKIAHGYIAVDISQSALNELSSRVLRQFPDLIFKGINAEYSRALQIINAGKKSNDRNLLLFLGSNIGNFVREEKIDFLRNIKTRLNPGDYFLIGFDQKKSRSILIPAYDDPAGLTRRFNLNLLNRINRELGGNFNIKNFSHFARYDKVREAMESYLISNCAQEVYIEKANQAYRFDVKEPVLTEYSHKYDLNDINHLAAASGFQIVKNFFDSRKYFVCSLWMA